MTNNSCHWHTRPIQTLQSLIGGAAWLMIAASGLAAEPSLIGIDDLYRFDAPQGLVLLPGGESAVYSRRWADRATRSVRFSLWRADQTAENRRPLEEGEPDGRQPILSPDGKWIAFLSTRSLPDGKPAFAPVPPYSDPATDIWLMPVGGGKPVPLAGRGKPYGRVFSDPFYGQVCFSPDGKRLAFVADDGIDPRSPEEVADNVQVVREDQGEGYEGYRPAQIWVADLLETPGDAAAVRVTRVTNDDVWYGDPQWMPDGKSLVVHANRTAERESARYSINQNFDLWRIDLASGKLAQLTTGPGPEFSPRISPDGKRLACLSSPRRGSHMDVFNLLVLDVTDSGARGDVLFDHHGTKADDPPHLPPSFPLPRDAWLSADKLYFSAADRTETRTQVIDLSQGPRAPADSKPEAHDWRRAAEAVARRRLTPAADPFLQERVVAKGEVVSWKSTDGRAIEGIFTRPTTPQMKPPYKLVLYPHGGPHSRSSQGFDFTVQVLAANGYAVFQPNFRGSGGYGQKFIDADRFDLGGQDMRDMLSGIDYLVGENLVDPKRQFVYGSSYGGYSTCTLITQTNQFRAAVPQNAVTDLHTMWGLSDIQSWTQWEFGGLPWEMAEPMRQHSPLTFASRVKTPTLILHSANDRRCPLPMGRMFYRALQKSGVETQMVIYPDEGHPIKQLPHQADMLRRVLDWFARHDTPAEPQVDLGGIEERHEMIPMRDGVRLSAYLYIPPGKGPWPVLLEQRYASGRDPSTRQSMARLAKGGYVVAMANFRGAQLSEGTWVGYRALGWGELKDGYDLVEWLAAQPWSSGAVGTFGSSQAGYAQNFLAVTQPPHLKAQYMIDTGLSLFHEGYRIGGTTRPERFKAMGQVCRVPEHNQALLREWFAHPTYDAYWADEDCTRFFGKMNVPCFTVGSWFDFMNQGSIESYLGRQHRGGEASRGRQQLLIGPWLHGRFKETNKIGQLTFPENAKFALEAHLLRWFDHHLKRIDNGVEREPAVRYYVMGAVDETGAPGNEWRTADDWPPKAEPTPLYLHADKSLTSAPPTSADAATTFLADPLHPAPIPGTAFPGAADARAFEAHSEVRTFTSDVLAEPVEWTGKVKAELFVSSDAQDTDFIVRICDVYPDGRSILLVDYIRRARYREGFEKEAFLKPGEIYPLTFDVGWLSQIFNKGHRIRVTVASTGAPFFEPNPNTGAPLGLEPLDATNTVVAKNTLHLNRSHASRIIAPVRKAP